MHLNGSPVNLRGRVHPSPRRASVPRVNDDADIVLVIDERHESSGKRNLPHPTTRALTASHTRPTGGSRSGAWPIDRTTPATHAADHGSPTFNL